jgi:hypothetical protein
MEDIKKLIESLDAINECPPEMGEGGMPPMGSLPEPMDKGNPVTMNVSLNASGKEHVEDLISMMKNAGMDAKPAMPAPTPMRMDIERLRDIMDEPKEEQIEESNVKAIIDMIANADDPEQMVMDLIDKGGPEGDFLYGELEQLATEKGKTFNDGETDPAELVPELLANMGIEEAYENEPEPEFGDMADAIPNGNDLVRKKKAYAKAQDGDNAMAVETIKKELLKALAEKKAKPDFLDMDKDGDKKEPMKKAIKDKESKKKTEAVEGVCEDCGNPSWKTLPEEKQKGVDGKVCWKGYKRMGTKKKGGKTVDNCVKM